MKTQSIATKDTVCNPELFRFPAVKKRQVAASFSGGDVTSDGGLPLLRQLDRRLGLTKAMAQVLEAIWDQTFSEYSYGFRAGRSQHMAIEQARGYIKEGHGFVVDLDLEKVFDRVNHDRLLSRLSTRVPDKRVLKLIGRFLRSGHPQGFRL